VAIVDTSPSLGVLNKVAFSTVDGFIVPCMPDMFSLYGIRNIGDALGKWKKQFDAMYSLISEQKRGQFPQEFVKFLGFTIYNARKYTGQNEWDLAAAGMSYARQIPGAIRRYIPADVRRNLDDVNLASPIGGTAVRHTHNTLVVKYFELSRELNAPPRPSVHSIKSRLKIQTTCARSSPASGAMTHRHRGQPLRKSHRPLRCPRASPASGPVLAQPPAHHAQRRRAGVAPRRVALHQCALPRSTEGREPHPL